MAILQDTNGPNAVPPNADEVGRAEQKILTIRHDEPAVGATSAGLLSGLAVGATAGAIAGPAGAAVGAVVGTAIGAAAGVVFRDMNESEEEQDQRLDDEIGVTSGSLGAAPPGQPRASGLHFSKATLGVGGTSVEAEGTNGPIPNASSETES